MHYASHVDNPFRGYTGVASTKRHWPHFAIYLETRVRLVILVIFHALKDAFRTLVFGLFRAELCDKVTQFDK
jgi:hypothetical protein